MKMKKCYCCGRQVALKDAVAIAKAVDILCNEIEGLEPIFSEALDLIHFTSDPKVLLEELLQRKEQLQKELDMVNEQIQMLNQIPKA